MRIIKNRYIGRFSIDLDTINKSPSEALNILQNVLVIEAKLNLVTGSIDYIGLHYKFNPVPAGEEPGYYVAYQKDAGEWSFKRPYRLFSERIPFKFGEGKIPVAFTEEEAKLLVARTAKNHRSRSAAAAKRRQIEAAQADIPARASRGHYSEREPGRGHKYGARAVMVDGIRFPSIAEAEYYKRSKLRQAAGEIDYFLLWPCFVLPGGVRVRFDQQIFAGGRVEYVDVKGKVTGQFRRNKKLVKELWPVRVKVVLYKGGGFLEIEV